MIGDYWTMVMTLMGDGHLYCWVMGALLLGMPSLLLVLVASEALSYTPAKRWTMRLMVPVMDALPSWAAMSIAWCVPGYVRAHHRRLASQAAWFLDSFDPDEWDHPDLRDKTTRARFILALPWV